MIKLPYGKDECCSKEILFSTVTFNLDCAVALTVLFNMVKKKKKVTFQPRLLKAKSR